MTIMYSFIDYLTNIKRMLHKMKHQILQGLLYILFQKSAACLQYTIYIYSRCSNNVSLPWDLKMHILQIAVLFKRRAAYIKGCYSKNMFVVLEEYHVKYSEKRCTILKNIFYMLTYTMCYS